MNAPPTPDFRPLRGGRSGAGFSDARARGVGRGAWAALLGLFVIAVALRAIGLGQQSLWIDEAFSYEYAKPDGPLPFADVFDNLHGPLHALLLHLWMKLAGHGEAAVRLPSLIASLLAWAAFWLYARRAWGARVAWTAGALLAVAPFHIWYAQECRNYSLLILFAVLAEWAFHRLTARRPEAGAPAGGPAAPPPPARAYAGYGLALLAGFLSNLSMAFFLLQHAVRLFLTARPAGGVRRRILWTWALVALCLLPWAISFYEHQVRPSRLLSTEAVPEEERL
ncbi:MAG: glycosyltransferase family 39 protein, partial [Candidatus Eisenbacteria bacterium]|nr:glycosyltransferase family 39 protein [Candidatus Eisenbacteria bacterium]